MLYPIGERFSVCNKFHLKLIPNDKIGKHNTKDIYIENNKKSTDKVKIQIKKQLDE